MSEQKYVVSLGISTAVGIGAGLCISAVIIFLHELYNSKESDDKIYEISGSKEIKGIYYHGTRSALNRHGRGIKTHKIVRNNKSNKNNKSKK